MRQAQPFDIAKESRTKTDEWRQAKYREEFIWSSLHRLRRLNNVDKHRRLNLMAFWPNMLYFASDEGDDTRFTWADTSFTDGSIMCHLTGPKAGDTHLHHEFDLVLTDDPANRPDDRPYVPRDCLRLLQGLSQAVGCNVSIVLSEFTRLDDANR